MNHLEEIDFVNFGIFSSEEIEKFSVAEITSPKLIGHGSVYDERLGSAAESGGQNCATCDLDCNMCPGHFGHINLNEPVIHPKYYKLVLAFLKCFCFKCHAMMIVKDKILLEGLMKYKRMSRFNKIVECLKKTDYCPNCKAIHPKLCLSVADSSFKAVYKKEKELIDIPISTEDIV